MAGKALVCALPDTLLGLPTRSASIQTGADGDVPTKLWILTKRTSELDSGNTYDLGSNSAYNEGHKLAYEGTATAPNSKGSTVSFATLIETEDFYIDEEIKFLDLGTDSPRLVKVDIAIPKGVHSSPQAIKTYVELGKCGDEAVQNGFEKEVAEMFKRMKPK